MPDEHPATNGTPEWWLKILEEKLEKRLSPIQTYDDAWTGARKMPLGTSRWIEVFGGQFDALRDNWAPIVIDASTERLKVEGFRFGAKSEGDDLAWAMWQANGLDAQSMIGHQVACALTEASAIVEPAQGSGAPKITVEHPAEVIVACAPGNRRERLAALKRWVDEDGVRRANVYLPTQVAKFRAGTVTDAIESPRARWYGAGQVKETDWERLPGKDAVVEHSLKAVPVVPLVNDPMLSGDGRSDLEPIIGLNDVIEKVLQDATIASEYGAYPQKWGTGIDDDDEENPAPKPSAKVTAIERIVETPNENARFGQFQPADLGNYVKLIELAVQHIAAKTRTPPHYLLGQSGAFPSGESLKSTETGLVAKVRRKQVFFGEDWEEVMRLAFRAAGDEERSQLVRAETIWRDPESRTEGERMDALVKAHQSLRVPRVVTWRMWGATPEEIKEWKELAKEEAEMDAVSLLGGFNPDPNAQNVR